MSASFKEYAYDDWRDERDNSRANGRLLLTPDFDSFVAFDIETSGSFRAASGDRPAEITEIAPLDCDEYFLIPPVEEDEEPIDLEECEIYIDSDAGVTIAHEAGAFYLQEPCAMLPAAVLNAQPEEKILDLCAAPGGKSTQIGIAMEGKGLLVCNEPIPKRAEILSRNLERIGICNAIVTCAYPKQLEERWAEAFDGILVDAPCSGEGMFR